MSSDLVRAMGLLKGGNYTCVLCKRERTLTSEKKGVAALVEWASQEVDLRGFCAADKIVGKAAALLFVRAGIREVYASVMSEAAAEVFSRYRVKAQCDKMVPFIINRLGTGRCPMEQAVEHLSEPEEALLAIKQKLLELANAGGQPNK